MPSSLPWLSGGSERACSRGGSSPPLVSPRLLTKESPGRVQERPMRLGQAYYSRPPLNPSTAGPASNQSTLPPSAVPQEGQGLI